jgi:hypothetical protein
VAELETVKDSIGSEATAEPTQTSEAKAASASRQKAL